MLRTCLLLALAVFVVAEGGDDTEWCRTTLQCIIDGEINDDKPICGVTGAGGPKETYKNLCEYQSKQCEKGILEVGAMVGACPVSCQNDDECTDGNVCKKVDSMGVRCQGGENDCKASCERPQEKIDLCADMVKNNQCPEATMKCSQKEDCTDKGCQYSASCDPLEKPEDCKIMGVQQCINTQMRAQAVGMQGKFDTCTLLNIYTTCGKNNGCTQTKLNWCLHGIPAQGNHEARDVPENCELPACEGSHCDAKAYRSCINDIAGGDLQAAYKDCDKLNRMLSECAVPQKCNVLYNCFQFKRHLQTCDLSATCGKMNLAAEDLIYQPYVERTTQRPRANHKTVVAIVGSSIGFSALVAVAVAIVVKRRRSADEAAYTMAL